MADINKFTTKEVLNKVLLDSSGNAIAANSRTSQEALNAVLDTSNNRLNVSLGGSNTISGDVTITGDLTVQGGGSLAFDEIIEGTSQVKVTNTSAFLVEKADGTDIFIVDTTNSNVKIPNGLLELGTADSTSGHINAFENMSFNIDTDNDDTNRFFEFAINGASGAGTELMRLTEATQLGIGSSVPDAWSYTNPVLTLSGGTTANNYVAFNLGAYSTSTTGILGDINFTQFASDGTTGAERAIVRAVNDGATDSVALKFYTTPTGGAVAERMVIDSNGKTRITASTAEVLSLRSGDSNGSHIIFEESTTARGYVGIAGSVVTSGGDNFVVRSEADLLLASGGNNVAMTIDSSQNVGIGIASGDGKVHIHSGSAGSVTAGTSGDDLVVENSGDAGISILSPDANSSRVQFGSANNNNIGHIGGFYNSGAFQLFFNVNGTNRFILDANSRISLSNNGGGSNTTFGYLALNSATANVASNVAIGHETLKAMDGTETGNVALGYQAMLSVDENVNSGGGTNSADFNVAIGYQALTGGQFTDGNDSNSKNLTGNIAIGANALNSTGTNPVTGAVAIGQSSLTAMTSGTGNTAVGYISGASLTTGSYNTFLGDRSGDATDDGSNNVAVGYQSLSANCGSSNVALGTNAGANQEGEQNVFIGKDAGLGASGSNNDGTVAIGFDSLKALTSGAGNTAVGMSSLSTGTGFSTNTALGFGSGKYLGGNGSANASSLNTCIGAYSMGGGNQSSPSSNTANQNTAIGHGVLGGGTGSSTNITAIKNVGVGYAVMNTVTTAQSNSILGYTAGIAITTGNENTVVGSRALGTADTATFNVVVGGDAMFGIPTGRAVAGVVAIGLEACKGGVDTTTGIDGSVAVGRASLKNITTGVSNVAVGYQTGDGLTDGGNNVLIGYNANSAGGTSASQNIGIGVNALLNAEGSNNVAIGYASGDLITSGGTNTLIGTSTDPSANNASNQTVIGHGATGVADNSVTLGNGDVTAVYMAQDSGATIYASNGVFVDDTSFITVRDSSAYSAGTGGGISFQGLDSTSGTKQFGTIQGYSIGNNNGGVAILTRDSGSNNLAVVIDNNRAVKPGANDAYDLGTSSLRWDDVFATNGTIDTSDERRKENIKDTSLGLDFVNKLKPKEYKWKDYDYEHIDNQDGEEPKSITKTRTFKRKHQGLLAQDVEKTLKDIGLTNDDFAGIVYDKESDIYGLRYSQLIAPLIKAVQELSAKVTELENK
jgi:hypothetical protein